MENLTGGLSEKLMLCDNKCPPNLADIMLKANKHGSLMCCSINHASESLLQNGLVAGHAYSITGIKWVPLRGLFSKEKVLLLRIRNPWGNEVEWNSKWSNGSLEWHCIFEPFKQMVGLQNKADGEFWIEFDDFKTNFSEVSITYLTINSPGAKFPYEVFRARGKGLAVKSAKDGPKMLHESPQYFITLVDPDENYDDNMCMCFVSLAQLGKIKHSDKFSLGFHIYKVDANVALEW